MPEGFETWYLYREISGDNAWFNDEAYVDTLNPRAMDKFIEITHEAYYRELGDSFGDTIPSIFTDEPQFCHKSTLGFAEEKKKVVLPYYGRFQRDLQGRLRFRFSLIPSRCIAGASAETVSANRYHYHDHICERFANAFMTTSRRLVPWYGIAPLPVI